MKRTSVLLPDHLAALLQRERRRRDVSAATIVREALEEYLTEDRRPKQFSFIGIGRSGRGDIAENMEELLAEEARSEEGFNRMMFGTSTRPDPLRSMDDQPRAPIADHETGDASVEAGTS